MSLRTNDDDAASDKATAAFVRRVLCASQLPSNMLAGGEKGRPAQTPVSELLPPLTSSNAVDLQLYGIIAVVIKEFVQTWYAKITPDHDFVDEVVRIIAHCTRALEQRLREVDLEALVVDEIPRLALQHLDAHWTSRRACEDSPLGPGYRHVYHALRPHPALTPVPSEAGTALEQAENEAHWRQLLVQGALAVLLPTEDLANGCLRALVGEIVAEMIIGGAVSSKMCEPWMLWEVVEKAAGALHPRPRAAEAGAVGLHGDGAATTRPHKPWTLGNLSRVFWMLCQYAFIVYTALRAGFAALVAASSLPLRDGQWVDAADAKSTAVLDMSAWMCGAQLVELRARMPWLAGVLSLAHWGAVSGPGRVGGTNARLDRLLSHEIKMRMRNPDLLPTVLRSLRAAIFPNNAPAPPRVLPAPGEEQLAIKRRAARAILDATPAFVRPRLFGALGEWGQDVDAAQQIEVERLLDVFGDPYLNKHLVFGIIELIVVRLMPEMGELGVDDLMDERLA